METKRCSGCQKHKPREDWTASAWNRGSGAPWSKGSGFCRECFNKWRRDRRAAQEPIRTVCAREGCGVAFETRSGVKKFCSVECKAKAGSLRRTAALRVSRADTRCAGCSRPLTHKNLGSKWCSKRCERSSPAGIRERRARYLWKRYRITLSDYEALVVLQGSACAICRSSDPKQRPGIDTWSVDHNHATGRVRGLLCASCNTAIGHLRDDPGIIASALRYVLEDISTQSAISA